LLFLQRDRIGIISRVTQRKRVFLQTCRLASLSVCLSGGFLWQNVRLDPDAIWVGEWSVEEWVYSMGAMIVEGQWAVSGVNVGHPVLTSGHFVA